MCCVVGLFSFGGCWQHPSMKLLQTMDQVHTDDVDDLDIHPTQPLVSFLMPCVAFGVTFVAVLPWNCAVSC